MVGEILTEVLVPLGFFAMVVLIVWTTSVSRRLERERRAELIRRVIDKFSTGEAFAQALESTRLADILSLEQEETSQGKTGLFSGGAITACLGIGFFILTALGKQQFMVPAVIVSSVGVALLLSSYVAWRAREKADAAIDEAVARISSEPGDPAPKD